MFNEGPSDAQDVMVTDVIPANTTFVSFTAPAGWSTSTPQVGGTGTVTATRPTLAQFVGATFTLVVNVDPATPSGMVISNTVTVTSTTAMFSEVNFDTELTNVAGELIPTLSEWMLLLLALLLGGVGFVFARGR